MSRIDIARAPSAPELDRWRRNGWVAVEDLIDPEMRALLPQWIDAIAQPAAPGEARLHYFEQTDGGVKLCRTERFIEDHPALAALLTDGALPAMAGALLGEPAQLYKEKINYKQPGGAGFAPHQDATAYAAAPRYVTCLLAVDPMTEANGCLEFSDYGGAELFPEDGAGCIAPQTAASLAWSPAPLAAGGAVFFTAHAPHRSGPNISSRPRRALYITYAPAAQGDLRAAYYRDRDHAIAGSGGARISVIGHFQGKVAR